MGLGKYYANKKDYNQSVLFYERALDLKAGRDNLLIFTNLAGAYKESGQIGKAIGILDKALEEYPDFAEARYMLRTLVESNPPDVFEQN
jgi:tetratricopeptide (TPR) repeat protein